MRALWSGRPKGDYLTDALTLLTGWIRDGQQIRRTLQLDDAQHAALTERIQVVADALRLRPEVRRLAGHTQIKVGRRDGEALSEGEVLLAARIEDAYRVVTDPSA
ncbi:pterin dehydratase [Micromonospora sp. CPCC 206060]|uniref:pterin dehydratase n=1 Tax=Micromonospora sp. CPCC 206060 TaxID=3122406 RepID=UPI002FF14A8E